MPICCGTRSIGNQIFEATGDELKQLATQLSTKTLSRSTRRKIEERAKTLDGSSADKVFLTACSLTRKNAYEMLSIFCGNYAYTISTEPEPHYDEPISRVRAIYSTPSKSQEPALTTAFAARLTRKKVQKFCTDNLPQTFSKDFHDKFLIHFIKGVSILECGDALRIVDRAGAASDFVRTTLKKAHTLPLEAVQHLTNKNYFEAIASELLRRLTPQEKADIIRAPHRKNNKLIELLDKHDKFKPISINRIEDQKVITILSSCKEGEQEEIAELIAVYGNTQLTAEVRNFALR